MTSFPHGPEARCGTLAYTTAPAAARPKDPRRKYRVVDLTPVARWCLTGIVQVFVHLYRPPHSCCLTRSLSRLVGRLDGDGRAVYLGAPHPPTSTILPLGGIPGSSSRI